MARRKSTGMIELPSGVHAVRAAGKVYYYWHPHRGTALEGKRVALGSDPRDPVFWEKLKAAQGKASGEVEPWTFAALAVAISGCSTTQRPAGRVPEARPVPQATAPRRP